MKYQVTSEDIKHGVRGCCVSCPVARAIQREHREDGVKVSPQVAWRYNDKWISANLPENARKFILHFDLRREVEPFEFELEWL